jgi:hypothetical protein
MPRAEYYREQARLLAKWANESRDPTTARRLMNSVRNMLALSERTADQANSEPDLFGFPASERKKSAG